MKRIISIAVCLGLFAAKAYPCTRVLSSRQNHAVLIGRTMDWIEEPRSSLWVFPRSMSRDGLGGKNSLKWVSKYASMVATAYDQVVVEGLNEAGLHANVLWLDETDYGERDARVPGLAISAWNQFVLDNFATVAEAVHYIETTPLQIISLVFKGQFLRLHLSLADATGDSAIVEYLNGKPVIHHDPSYDVMTNSPTYPEQRKALGHYQGFGGESPLPGTAEARDRYVRASYYVRQLPEASTLREALSSLLSIMRNVSQPFGVLDPSRPYLSTTWWRSVADVTRRTFYFESTLSPNLVWAGLASFDSSPGASPMRLDLARPFDYAADVSSHFVAAKPFVFLH